MTKWSSLVARLRRFNPTVADGLLGLFLFVIALPQLLIASPVERTLGYDFRDASWLGVLLLLVETVPLTWRRRAPVLVLAASTAASLVLLVSGFRPTAADVALFVGVYTVAGRTSLRTAVITGLCFAVALGAIYVIANLKYPQDSTQLAQGYVVGYATFTFAWFLGVLQRNRREHTAKLEALNAQLAEERESRARWAVAEERGRIARELHDVVAHSVSVMVVQAGAARRIAKVDPEQAHDAISAIESTGRQALAEMRRLVGVLRRGDEPTSLDPQPQLADVGALVEQTREAGLPVALEVEGAPRPLPAGVDLSAYRIVQEALTNIRKHAGPASARVRVRYDPRSLEVEVVDDGRGAAWRDGAPAGGADGNGGHGLIGMRERVALFGGQLEVGPQPAGGFRVAARLPLEAAAQ
jgi:signal transduction histidine kinase